MPKNSLLEHQVRLANKGKIKIKKPKKWLYPMPAERIYTKQLLALHEIFWDKVRAIIIPQIPQLSSLAKSLRPDDNGLRIDATWVEQIKELTEKTYFDFASVVNQARVSLIAKEQAERISMMNKAQFVKVIHSSLSIIPIVQETWLDSQMKAFTNQNVDLITNLGQDQRKRIDQNLYQNLSAGNGIDKIKEDLQKSENIGKNRAKLIARDQTNKFNGQLTQLRQQEVGIGSYIWTTARDERVRPSHRALDGETIAWNNPPSEGHAGQPIQCRCIAQPIINDAMFD